MKKLRAAVIGCGAIGHFCHIPGYANNKSCDLVALVDPSTKNRKSACEKFNVERGYKDIDQLFKKEELDVVSVCSPNAFHASNAITALNNGCHVLCEKPLCLTMKEAATLKRAAKKAGTIFMVAFSHRFNQGNIKARRAIDNGKIGKPFMIRLRFAHEGPMAGWAMTDWFYKPEKAGGGALFDMGIHAIDLASYYMGTIKKVNAMTGTLEKKISLDDNAILQFEFESGKLGYAEVGWTSKQGFSGVEIYGSEGAIVMDYVNGVSLITGSTNPSGKRTVKTRTIEKEPAKGGWDIEIDHFIKCIRRGEQPEMGLDAGIDALRVALGAYESAKKGKTIQF